MVDLSLWWETTPLKWPLLSGRSGHITVIDFEADNPFKQEDSTQLSFFFHVGYRTRGHWPLSHCEGQAAPHANKRPLRLHSPWPCTCPWGGHAHVAKVKSQTEAKGQKEGRETGCGTERYAVKHFNCSVLLSIMIIFIDLLNHWWNELLTSWPLFSDPTTWGVERGLPRRGQPGSTSAATYDESGGASVVPRMHASVRGPHSLGGRWVNTWEIFTGC